uniref:Uncharacterized protein n=1 Tax=Rhipicephalus zambeziensis TaxID=60191 RepID=A0A224YGI4_9ACAR
MRSSCRTKQLLSPILISFSAPTRRRSLTRVATYKMLPFRACKNNYLGSVSRFLRLHDVARQFMWASWRSSSSFDRSILNS